jgi:hypothetical protein
MLLVKHLSDALQIQEGMSEPISFLFGSRIYKQKYPHKCGEVGVMYVHMLMETSFTSH